MCYSLLGRQWRTNWWPKMHRKRLGWEIGLGGKLIAWLGPSGCEVACDDLLLVLLIIFMNDLPLLHLVVVVVDNNNNNS
jgi:hypothetical protein